MRMRAGVLCRIAVVALVLQACRPPLTPTPCGPGLDCPRGYTCDPVRGYCAPRTGSDAAAADASQRDAAPTDVPAPDRASTDLRPADHTTLDHRAADHLARDQFAVDARDLEASAADLQASDGESSDRQARDQATRDQAASDRDRVEGGALDSGAVAGDARPGDAVSAPEAATAMDRPPFLDGGLSWQDGAVAVEAGVGWDAAGPPEAGGLVEAGGTSEAGAADLASVYLDGASTPDHDLGDQHVLLDAASITCSGLCLPEYPCTQVSTDTYRCCTPSLDNTLLCLTEPDDVCVGSQQPLTCWLNGTMGECCGQSDGCKNLGDVAGCTSGG